MGWAEGMRAGTEMAQGWIGAYNDARKKYEYSQAMQGGDTGSTDVGVDYLKSQLGLDDDGAQKALAAIRADPTKAASILNATNAVTGGAAGNALPAQAAAQAGAQVAGGTAPPQPLIPGAPAPGVPGGTPGQVSGQLGPSAFGTPSSAGVAPPTQGVTPPPAAAPAAPPPAADVGGAAAGTSAAGGPAVPPPGMPPGTTANPFTPGAAPPVPTPATPAAGLTPPAGAAGAQPANAPVAANAPAMPTTPAGPTGTPPGETFNMAAIPEQYQPAFAAAMQKYPNVPPQTIAAIVQQESRWNPGAVNPDTHATGIAQYLPNEAAKRGFDPTDPNASIMNAFADASHRIQMGYKPDDVIAAHFGGDDRNLWKNRTTKYVSDVNGNVPMFTAPGGVTGTGAKDITKPPTQQALNTQPQVAADNLDKLTKLSTRMFIDPSAKFNVDAQGNVTMQGKPSDSDRFLNMARVALKWGDAQTAKTAMDSHFEAKAEEANNYVKNVLSSDLSDDQKVSALAHGTGIQIYKADNGQYIVPALSGGPDQNGQYKRLSMTDIGNLSQSLTTQEGIKNLYAYQAKNQEMATEAEKARSEEAKNAAMAGYYQNLNETRQAIADTRAAASKAIADARANAKPAAMQKPTAEIQAVQGSPNHWLIPIPDGAGGSTMQESEPAPAGFTTMNGGQILSTEVPKAQQIAKDIAESPYGQDKAEPGGAYIGGVVPAPLKPSLVGGKPFNDGDLHPESGKVGVYAYAQNPQTGNFEPFHMVNGKPMFAQRDPQSGEVHAYVHPDAKSASADAKAYAEYRLKAGRALDYPPRSAMNRSPAQQAAQYYQQRNPGAPMPPEEPPQYGLGPT